MNFGEHLMILETPQKLQGREEMTPFSATVSALVDVDRYTSSADKYRVSSADRAGVSVAGSWPYNLYRNIATLAVTIGCSVGGNFYKPERHPVTITNRRILIGKVSETNVEFLAHVPFKPQSVASDSDGFSADPKSLLNILRELAHQNKFWWDNPLQTIDFDDSTILEWWKKDKKLTLYTDGESLEYIKVWGARINEDMEDGLIGSRQDLLDLWKWIAT
jgi:hypothetical protein